MNLSWQITDELEYAFHAHHVMFHCRFLFHDKLNFYACTLQKCLRGDCAPSDLLGVLPVVCPGPPKKLHRPPA